MAKVEYYAIVRPLGQGDWGWWVHSVRRGEAGGDVVDWGEASSRARATRAAARVIASVAVPRWRRLTGK